MGYGDNSSIYSAESLAGYVTMVTNLPGVIICKALSASFNKQRRYIRTAYYGLLLNDMYNYY